MNPRRTFQSRDQKESHLKLVEESGEELLKDLVENSEAIHTKCSRTNIMEISG